MKKFLQKFTMIVFALALFFAPYESIIIQLVSANTSYKYLSDMQETSAKVGYGSFKKNKNDSNEMISLMIDNQRTYSMNALYAHASSTIIYDLSDYPTFDTFSSYVGVDASRGDLGNVKFYIYGSKADSSETTDWHLLTFSKALMGNSEAEKITASITGYKWLKLVADSNGDKSSDHAVYFDAMIYDSSKYDSSKQPTVDWIKTVDDYDVVLNKETDANIVGNESLKLQLLQRTLVKRVGYPILQAFVNKNDRNAEFFEWLFKDANNLEEYLLGGTPEGNNYLQSLTVFEELYFKHKDDLKDGTYGETYKKMMMAISLAYGSDVNFWQTANTKYVKPERTPSYPLKRYEVLKQLLTTGYTYEEVSTHFENEIFMDLEIEEMRWVVNNRISDEEIPWLNWYTQMTQKGKTPYGVDGYKNPYNYIYYDSGFRWNYENPEYYQTDSKYCSTTSSGNLHKSQTDKGYERGMSCNEKYGLKHFNIETGKDAPLRLWTIWEEDGVCGSLAGTGSNINMAYGVPSSLVSQPGHAAFFVSSVKEVDGQKIREWGIDNAAANWSRSYKGERMLLDWGTRTYKWVNNYNAAYVITAQRALNNFEDYKKAFIYNLIADVRKDTETKIKSYELAISAQKYNVDAWYGLIQTILQDETTTSEEYLEVARNIMKDFEEFPLPMYDLLELFDYKIENTIAYNKLLTETLTKQSTTKNYSQYAVINDVAKYLLGIKGDSDIATFSFDGKDAGILKFVENKKDDESEDGSLTINYEYTLNYSYEITNPETGEGKVSDNTEWIQVPTGTKEVDLRDKLAELTVENDIVINKIGNDHNNPDNLFFIDLTIGERPENMYFNENERKFANIDRNVTEWTLLDTEEKQMAIFTGDNSVKIDWHKFSEEDPKISDEGGEFIAIRNGYTKTYLPSDVMIEFSKAKSESKEFSYVPIAKQEITTSSNLNEGDEQYLADMGINSYWTAAKGDSNAFVKIKLSSPIQLSKLEYVPCQKTDAGIITKAKIEVSLDDEHWNVIAPEVSWNKSSSAKGYIPVTPVRAKYIRITALDSTYDRVSAAMFNVFENKLTTFKSVNDLNISYVTTGYTYNGGEIKPSVTVKDGETELVLDEHYILKYENNIKAGKGKITLIGLGAYDGEKELEFDIAKAKAPEINLAEGICVDADKDTLSEVDLPDGWHWKNPETVLEVGETKAIAVYDDTDNYEATEVEIKVVKEKGHHPVINIQEGMDSFEYKLPVSQEDIKSIEDFKSYISITDEEDTLIDVNSDNVSVTSDIKWDEAGTYHVTIIATDSDGNTTTSYIQVVIKPEDDKTIELTNEEYEVVVENDNLYYNGQKHEVTVKVIKKQPVAQIMTASVINNVTGHELTEKVDYELVFDGDFTNAGEHKITIKGIGIYEGTLTASYKINKALKPTNMIHPEMTVSSDTTKLEQIYLDGNWQWSDAETELKEGENIVKIIFLGDDNHERYETEMLVVRDKANKPEPTPSNPTPSESETKPSETKPQAKPTESETDNNKEDNSNSSNTESTKKPSSSNSTTTNKEEVKPTEDNKVEENVTDSQNDKAENRQESEKEQNETNEQEDEKETEKVTEEVKDDNSKQTIIIAIVVIAIIALIVLIILLVKMR